MCRAAGCTHGTGAAGSSASSLTPRLLLRGGPLLPPPLARREGSAGSLRAPGHRAADTPHVHMGTGKESSEDLEATQPQNNLQSGNPVLPAEPPETPPAPPGSTEPPSGLGSGHEHGLPTLALRVPLNTCSPTQVPGAGGCWALTSLPLMHEGQVGQGPRTQSIRIRDGPRDGILLF